MLRDWGEAETEEARVAGVDDVLVLRGSVLQVADKSMVRLPKLQL